MSMLQKFTAQTRIKVDPSLAERWEFDARRFGESPIKKQIAHAKRTATTLKKAREQFVKIRPEQELALKAAASAIDTLVLELVPLVPWAKAYREFCEAEYQHSRLQALEAIAFERWGTDTTALQFEANLAQELGSREGKHTFALWVHSIGQHKDVDLDRISSCVDGLKAGNSLRERMAATVEEEKRTTDNKWLGVGGLTVICGWSTYDRYLHHRRQIAGQADGVIARASRAQL